MFRIVMSSWVFREGAAVGACQGASVQPRAVCSAGEPVPRRERAGNMRFSTAATGRSTACTWELRIAARLRLGMLDVRLGPGRASCAQRPSPPPRSA